PFSVQGIEPIVFRAPATILLSAASSAGSSSVTAIEFIANGTVVAVANAPTASDDQFKALWRNVVAGTYVVTAKLTDIYGFSSVSNPITVVVGTPDPPSVTLLAPTGEQIFPYVSMGTAQSIAYGASVSDPAGSVARVEFDDNSRFLAWPTSPPYAGTLSSPTGGLHVITARALDARYRELARSAPAYALVGGRPLAAVMTSPVQGATYGSSVTLSVDAVAPDSMIGKVAFYSGSTLLGSTTTPPYSIGASFHSGVQRVYALVQGPFSGSTITVPITFNVSGLASGTSIEFTSPYDGQTLYAPADIPLAVAVTDPSHLITRVEYYWSVNINGGLVATAAQAPWTAAWTGVGAGEYWLTAVGVYAGGKITSAPVHVSVVAAPPVVLTAPANGSLFAPGQSIALSAQATVAGHALSRIDFVSDGAVVGSVAIAGGPSSANVSYGWSGATAGVHSLTAKAVASDGYTSTSAPITVDVTDLAVTLAEPSPSQVYLAPADVRIVAGALETDGTIAQVDFYGDGGYLGSRTAAPYTFVWTGVAVGAHTVTARARDAAGYSVSAAAITVTAVAASTMTIDAGIDGASVADDNVSISGTVQAPMNSAVVVNGKGAALDRNGRFFVDNVPLQPGSNSLTVALNTQDGAPVTRILEVGSSGAAPFQVTVDPQEGLAPLSATMTITNRGKVAFQRIEIDIGDDGTAEQTLTALTNDEVQLELTFPNAGTYAVRVKVRDASNGVIYSAIRRIVARDPREVAGIATGVFQAMLDRLGTGNIAGAMTAITAGMQGKYQAIFGALQPNLQTIVGQVGTVQWINVADELAEIGLSRNGATGLQTFQVYVLRSEDGIWRIDGM
ncbi:MAG TPA: Ig-like domain-containing protein, partial [Gemmatimonadaceae bacterium]|nr:Ig-like domain-containing protein [Gemmatimonadaceae bacterium]